MPIEIDGTEYLAYVHDGSEDIPYDVYLGDDTEISTHSLSRLGSVVAHYDAQSLDLTDGDYVGGDQPWVDLVGDNDAATGSFAELAGNGINANPAVVFDGSSENLVTGLTIDTTEPQTMFAAVEADTTSTQMSSFGAYSNGGTTNRWYYGMQDGNWAAGVGDGFEESDSATTAPVIITLEAANGTATKYVNGEEIGSFTYSGVGTTGELLLGARNDDGSDSGNWDGYIGEVVQAGAITASERIAEVERMANRWGINIYDIDATVTQDEALSNGSDENVYTVTATKAGAAFEGQNVHIVPQTGGSSVSWDSTGIKQTDANGQVEYTATNTESETVTADFELLDPDDNSVIAIDSATSTFGDPAYFDVTGTSTNEPVQAGETLEVDYTVENTGVIDGTQDIYLQDFDDNVVDGDLNVSVSGGSTETGTLDWNTSESDEGSGIVDVFTDDDLFETIVTLDPPITVIDDFESDSMSNWGGDTGSSRFHTISTSQLEGNYAARTGSFDEIYSDHTCSRGNEYKVRFYNTNSSETLWFLVGLQDTSNPIDDCYFVYIRYDNDEIRLMERSGGSNSEIDEISPAGLSTNTEYRVGIEYGSPMRLNWYDDNDDLLDSVSGNDSTHSGGRVGFYGGNGTGSMVDYITEDSL